MSEIKKQTNHKYIKLTDSGNKAIYAAMYYLKQEGYEQIIIPDQGGWITYKQYPKKMKLGIIELKTDKGLVILDELEKVCKKVKKKTALLITSYAGYYAEQDLKGISDVCKKHNILLIEDTNAFGDDKLCNGKLADIILCSFGKWKVVDNKQGGFISAKDKKVIEIIESADKINEKVSPKDLDEEQLLGKIKLAHERLIFLEETCNQMKKELIEMGLNVFHSDKRGIVVVVEAKTKKAESEIKKYCDLNELEFTECPRYIRVNEPAISIEVKRMEFVGNADLI